MRDPSGSFCCCFPNQVSEQHCQPPGLTMLRHSVQMRSLRCRLPDIWNLGPLLLQRVCGGGVATAPRLSVSHLTAGAVLGVVLYPALTQSSWFKVL